MIRHLTNTLQLTNTKLPNKDLEGVSAAALCGLTGSELPVLGEYLPPNTMSRFVYHSKQNAIIIPYSRKGPRVGKKMLNTLF